MKSRGAIVFELMLVACGLAITLSGCAWRAPDGAGGESGVGAGIGGVAGSQSATCGNGVVEFNEACDDGNTVSGDACRWNCTRRLATCGNGTVEYGEVCDDGEQRYRDACTSDCSAVTTYCGDGIVQPPEICDMPNQGGSFSGNYFDLCDSITCQPRTGATCDGEADEDAGAAPMCRAVGESGVDIDTDVTELTPSQWVTMCEWFNRIKTERPSLSTCPSFNYERPQDNCMLDMPNHLTQDQSLGIDLHCGVSVFEYERCMRHVDTNPCAAIDISNFSVMFRPDCFEEACWQ